MSNTIVFFGNERLATGVTTDTPTLCALLDAGYEIAAIVSNYTEAQSRNLRSLEVARIAEKHNIPLWCPKKLQDIAMKLEGLHADIGVLAAYGKIIPQTIIDIFPHGIVNIHPSLLPLHRGSIPIESVILEGASETGVSIMQLVKEMDAGPVYAQERVTIPEGVTKQTLTDTLLHIGSALVIKNLPAILTGSLLPVPQHNEQATYDNLIKKQDGQIKWDKSAVQIEREIRAYAVWPKSQTTLADKNIVITKARIVEQQSEAPGNASNKLGRLVIQCQKDALEIEKLIPAGKQEMSGQAFLAGYGKFL